MKAAAGMNARARKGWWLASRFLILRRLTQASILALFMIGPVAGGQLLSGNLSSSEIVKTVPLTDPFVLLQSLLSGAAPTATALTGAALVVLFYALVGGRVFCAWVCPMNIVTDTASWLRRRLNLRTSASLSRHTRWALLISVLAAALLSGALAWELINPVSLLQRGLIFGITWGWFWIAAIALFDLLILERGWCGHLCPMGAFYSLLGKKRLLYVEVAEIARCNQCLDCYSVCPEQHVLKRPLKIPAGSTARIDSIACSNCLRCIDVCAEDVFRITTRFAQSAENGR